MKKVLIPLFLSSLAFPLMGVAQSTPSNDGKECKWQPLNVNFNVQSDMLLSTAERSNKQWFGNTFVTGILQNNFLEARIRFEELSHPLPGHEPNKGRGIPHLSLTGRLGSYADLTVGDFYEQFGSGVLLRSYEERNLGIDNAIRGGRITARPYEGIAIKALWGQHRNYFDRPLSLFNKDRGFLGGADLELGIDRWIPALMQSGTHISLGGGFVSKSEPDEIIPIETNKRLHLPKRVPAFGGRLSVQHGDVSLYGEYAYKLNDPTADNNYIYHPGSVAMVSASYAKSGFSALLQAKRSENFNYLSKRSVLGLPLHINYLPPFSQQQTYTLAALYPYATQPAGEWAMQGELRYTFKRNTFLGGKYGTQVRFNASHIRGLDRRWIDRDGKPLTPEALSSPELIAQQTRGGEGYKATFFGMGELYFQDYNFELSKKVTPSYSFAISYMHQQYNKLAITQHEDPYDKENMDKGDKNALLYRTHVFVYDGKHKLNRKLQLRTELQYLHTRQGEGDWLFGMAELSIQPGLIISLSDQFNLAGRDKKHYYMAAVAYTHASHRIQLSLGQTREGINCSGGVCRLMPATRGIYLSYNGSF